MADAETFGLIRVASVQRLKRMVVVTKDEENVVEKDGHRIEVLPCGSGCWSISGKNRLRISSLLSKFFVCIKPFYGCASPFIVRILI